MGSLIQELARTVGLKGAPDHKVAEPSHVRSLPVIDNSLPNQSAISTSVDCYVSGQYVQKNGKVIEVTQRYTIFVKYSKSTQMQTMNQIRDRILSDFKDRYGKTFNVTNSFIPGLPVPKRREVMVPDNLEDISFYEGSSLFRDMTRYERMLFEIDTQRDISRVNIQSIKERYGYE